ncbi:peptide MFS transporter [Enterococcus sp. AZ194]|uniref:peptide MFS transporter n=1 Tax=Enterococcus sp. AZ194 TaxID=2774629 RepID=UPI003F689014
MEKVSKPQRQLFGHPVGLTVSSFMALAQAFGNYGMSAILIYYLYKSTASGGLGFTQDVSAQLVNVYNSLMFMAGIIGAYVADRFIGVRKAMVVGYLMKTVGYALLAIPGGGVPLYLVSQLVLLFSAASMGTSLYAMAGKLYKKEDSRRDAGFSVMYIMNNVGAIAPVITGSIALALNYHAGFLFAAVIQGAGFILYVMTAKSVYGDIGMKPDDPFPATRRKKMIAYMLIGAVAVIATLILLFVTGVLTPKSFSNIISTISIFIPLVYLVIIITSKKTSPEEAVKVRYFIFIFVCNCFNMMIWSQSTSILAIYAAEQVNLNFLGMEWTPAAFQTVPAVFAVVFGSILGALWTKMGAKQPNTAKKFGLGTFLWGLGPIFMVIPFMLYSSDVKVSPLWLIVFYAIIILGEGLTSPIGMASATMVAPAAFTAQMVTVWQLSQSTGAGLSAIAVNFYKQGHESTYFLVIGGITAGIGLLVWLLNKNIASKMQHGK